MSTLTKAQRKRLARAERCARMWLALAIGIVSMVAMLPALLLWLLAAVLRFYPHSLAIHGRPTTLGELWNWYWGLKELPAGVGE